MRNEKHRAVAAAIQAAAKGSVLVLATADSQVLAAQDPTKALLSQELAGFECKSCATKMTASADLQPYCITCGSEHVAKTETTAKVVATASADKVGVQCAGCNTVMVLDSKVVTASGGHLHCSCCGSSLKVQASADSEPAAEDTVKLESDDSDNVEEAGEKMSTPEQQIPSEELPLDQVESATDEWPFKEESSEKKDEPESAEEQALEDAAEAPKAEESAKDGDADADDLEISLPDDDGDEPMDIEGELSDMEDFEPDAESELAHSEMLLPENPLEAPSVQVPGEETATDLETGPGADGNYFLESGADETLSETPVKITEPKEGETLADALEVDDTTAGVAFTASSGRLVVLKGHVAIASLTKAAAKENADMIFSQVFHAAVEHQVKKFGLRAGLNAMGFSMVRVPTLSKATVARKVQQLQQASANKDKAREKVFASSFAIAAAGLSRGRWKGYENPLRAAVEQQLTMAGVKNARVVAARIFEQHAIPFSKSMLELASKLAAMSEDTRKEMAESLEMTTEASESVAPEIQHEEASDSPELNTVDARLMSTAALLRPSTARNIQATASAYSTAQAILDGTAPLTFGV